MEFNWSARAVGNEKHLMTQLPPSLVSWHESRKIFSSPLFIIRDFRLVPSIAGSVTRVMA